jgi:hypothetical protein
MATISPTLAFSFEMPVMVGAGAATSKEKIVAP